MVPLMWKQLENWRSRSLNHKLGEAAGDDEFVQDQARINFIFNCVLARDVSDTESEIPQKGLVRARIQFADTPGASLELLSVGESPRDETLNATSTRLGQALPSRSQSR